MNSNEPNYIQHVTIEKLKSLCNPYDGCWLDIDKPIGLNEISECLDKGGERLVDTEINRLSEHAIDARQKHIQKIAYFVRHGFTDPLSVDIGSPELNCWVDYIITDGNHRFAAAIYRLDVLKQRDQLTVPIAFMGCLEYARELALFEGGDSGDLYACEEHTPSML